MARLLAAEARAVVEGGPKYGMIFEFTNLDQAHRFAAIVKFQFDLDGRVFATAEEAERSHDCFKQYPPVAHIDRPWWKLPNNCSREEWDAEWAIEPKIHELAEQFGGTFVGT